MSTSPFCDTLVHQVKRKLSEYEKESAPTSEGRAFILPSLPPTQSRHRSEVEELISIGYYHSDIIGVESDLDIAIALDEHYCDFIQVHYTTAEDHLNATKSKFSYIHLDFCSELKAEEAMAILATKNAVGGVSRIRVTVSNQNWSGKTKGAGKYGKEIREEIILPFLHSAALIDKENTERWFELTEQVKVSDDPTQIISFLFLMTHFFGLNFYDYYINNTNFPEVNGNHIVKNISRWSYKEDENNWTMATVWVDLYASFEYAPPDPKWVLEYVYDYCYETFSQIVSYNAMLQAEGD